MTHFPVLVILPKETDMSSVEDKVSELLAPYDENTPNEFGEAGWFREGSRWDWWEIGGRWSGWLGDDDITTVSDINTEVSSEIRRIVTPDGAWHEEARAGWFGFDIPNESGESSNKDWPAERSEILSGCQSMMAVLVDCHV